VKTITVKLTDKEWEEIKEKGYVEKQLFIHLLRIEYGKKKKIKTTKDRSV